VRLTPGLFVVLVLAAIVFFAVPIVGSSSRCSEADEYFDNYLTSDAEKAYREVLADDPDSDCGAKGMTDVITRRCSEAAELVGIGELKAAEDAYLELLKMESPSNPPYAARRCAFKALPTLRARQKAEQQSEEKADHEPTR
jgi:hypothetical protein